MRSRRTTRLRSRNSKSSRNPGSREQLPRREVANGAAGGDAGGVDDVVIEVGLHPALAHHQAQEGADVASEHGAGGGGNAGWQVAGPDVAFNMSWNEALDVTNICLNAALVARGALLREESRGSHYRADFPTNNPRWLKRIRLQQQDGAMNVSYIPVDFHRMTPPELEPAVSTT